MTLTSSARLVTMDAVRGVAVMGILLMNILAFALPQPAYFNPAAYGGSTGADFWAWAIGFVLIDGKMRGLFSMLFGASMLLVIAGSDEAGGNGLRTHFVRMAWLLVFGIAHYWLLWYGDILTMYALMGCIAVWFVDNPTRSLFLWSAALFIASFLLWVVVMSGAFALDHAAHLPGASSELVTSANEMRSAFGEAGSPAIAQEVAAYRGSWFDSVAYRAKDGPFAQLVFVAFGGLETLALMLLGMALFRDGFLKGEWDDAAYRRTMWIGYAIGIPGSIALAITTWAYGFDTIVTTGIAMAAMLPFRIAVTIGHAALLVGFVQGGARRRLVARLAAAGRVAFSNYLGTTVLMTTLFYGYGFGLYGHLSRWQIYLVPPFAFALMLLWSKPWLDHFRYGPLEWLWRSLSRGAPQPMLR